VNILIISDGRMGHLNQSIAFAKHLNAHYEIIPVTFRYKIYKVLSYVLDYFKIYTQALFHAHTLPRTSFDLVVSAGSSTYYANKTLSKKLGIKSVAMMLPQSYRYDFDLIFAQEHDTPPLQPNITVLPANFSFVEPKGLFTPHKKAVGVIIGGNNSLFIMSTQHLKQQLDFIFEIFHDYEIAVTTSPRTPKEIETLIESYPFAYSVIFSQNKINPISDFLHHCEIVFITMDSTSMISEAISYGASYVEILPLNNAKENKFSTMAHNLEKEGYLHIFDGKIAHKNKKIDFEMYAKKALS